MDEKTFLGLRDNDGVEGGGGAGTAVGAVVVGGRG